MLITAIGITKKLHPYASESRRAIQEFLARHNLQPYLPQCAVLKTANLTLHYEHGRGLVWPDAAWEEVRRFPQPLIAHIGEYWLEYSNTNAVSLWQWRSGDGRVVTFDTASNEEMERFWRDIRESAAARGVTRPWVLIDEPPASAAHGLTPTVLRRVTRLVAALNRAGLTVGVCVPGPSQLKFWQKYIAPPRWLLGAKYDRGDYRALPAAEIWLYNRNAKRGGKTMAGLAGQMEAFGATGYLQWTFDDTTGTLPIGRYTRKGPEWTEEGMIMLRELAEYEARCERGDTLRAAVRSLRAMVAALTAQLDELEARLDAR